MDATLTLGEFSKPHDLIAWQVNAEPHNQVMTYAEPQNLFYDRRTRRLITWRATAGGRNADIGGVLGAESLPHDAQRPLIRSRSYMKVVSIKKFLAMKFTTQHDLY